MRRSNVRLQQVPQPFVMATFISTTLKTSPITLTGTGGERERKQRRWTRSGKRLTRLNKSVGVWGFPEKPGHRDV